MVSFPLFLKTPFKHQLINALFLCSRDGRIGNRYPAYLALLHIADCNTYPTSPYNCTAGGRIF
jgi:hypothetical protein